MQRCDLAAWLAAQGLWGLPRDGRQWLLLPVPLPPHTGQKVPLPSLQGKDGSAQTTSGPSGTCRRPKTASAPSKPVSQHRRFPLASSAALLGRPRPSALPRCPSPPPGAPTLHPSSTSRCHVHPQNVVSIRSILPLRSAWRLPVILDSVYVTSSGRACRPAGESRAPVVHARFHWLLERWTSRI